MAHDPRTPVIIGVGQFSNRVDQGADPLEPIDLMAEALRRAATDAGRPDVLGAADSIRVSFQLSRRYHDPGRLVAGILDVAVPDESLYTVMGGNNVQRLLNRTANEILDGDRDLVLFTGAEAWRTRAAARRDGTELPWPTREEDGPEPVRFGDDRPMASPEEAAVGIGLPVQVYPMVDNALGAAAGRSRPAHRAHIGALYARASEVAAKNPHAWTQEAFTATELITATPDNRMIGFPYTKRLNSNNMVDQGAALIVCSAERAAALGVDPDRWVFLHAGADADDHWFMSERDELHRSPGMRTAGRRALELAGLGPDDPAHLDLYSCFPSAVQLAATEIGLGSGVGDDRPLTVTGGMSFAGGPWNNYVMHSLATMVERLRDDPGATGLVSGNGGFFTEHSFGVLAGHPPTSGRFAWASTQDEVDALPRRTADPDPSGQARIEAWTVLHDRGGAPELALVAARTGDDRRAWLRSGDAATMAALLDHTEPVGATIEIGSEHAFAL